MRKRTHFILAIFALVYQHAFSQSFGGQRAFPFLSLPTHARVAALGGQVASSTRPDGVYFQNNPALADSLPGNQLSLSFMPYLAAAKYYTIQYGLPIKSKNGPGGRSRWAAGLQYLSYGQFDLTDPQGNTLGTFTANDYALSLTHARTEGNFSLGATVKAVGSAIETYSAFGLMADFGAVWRHPEHELSVGLVAKNAGVLLRNFGPADADLPFDLQAGVTFKPRYAPVRLTLTGYQLHRFDIVYNDPALNVSYDLNGNPIPRQLGIANRLAHHLIVGAEFLFSRNVNVMVAYNHRQRQEGKLLSGAGLAGLSFGASVQARAFQLTYARFVYAPTSGGSSQLSLRMNLARLL